MRSSFSTQRLRDEKASEAGSSVAKRRLRWRAYVHASASVSVDISRLVLSGTHLRAPVDGRRSGPGKRLPLTGRSSKRSWFCGRGVATPSSPEDDKNARGLVDGLRARPIKPCRGQHPCGARCERFQLRLGTASAVDGPKLEGVSSNASPAGADLPKGKSVPHGGTRFASGNPPLRSA